MEKKYQLTKYACYVNYISMAAVICLSPLLFVTFREQYGISYTKLGLLAVFNFCSQLIIDLIFTFFSRFFNIEKTVKLTPVITSVGIVIYALGPKFFPENAYFWLVLGTIVFSVAAGLCEVLLSPTVAAIPSEDPGREMSKLHSVYAWGVVAVVVVSSVFLKLFSTQNWHYLALLWCIAPVVSSVFYAKGKMPEMTQGMTSSESSAKNMLGGMLGFTVCIFLGSATENTMSQWCSSFTETALGFSKFTGDLLGMALLSVMLGVVRSWYGKKGKKIEVVLLVSFIGAFVSYLVAGFSNVSWLGLCACVACGMFISMLWPGTIIWTEERFPSCGVAVYALLAAAGDFGAGFAPQLMGIITDTVSKSSFAEKLSLSVNITTNQVGMRSGMVLLSVFPLLGIFTVVCIIKKQKNKKNESRVKK